MKRSLPLAIVFIGGVVFFISYFVPHYISEEILQRQIMVEWIKVISLFAFVIGLYSLIHLHVNKIKRKVDNWQYSILTLSGIGVMFIVGILLPEKFNGGIQQGSIYDWIFMNLQVPLQATMFSLLAFYITSAAFRAFKARSVEATCLLLAAVVVMLGRVPLGETIRSITQGFLDFPKWTQWILDVPNTATKRAIMLGVALGMMATSLKIILGIERSWLGGSE
ncbi:hypothetical protein KAU33_07565 [Candidatus Dependentiae bacterium]|nr:hypothetical protein [Candidatus Dependentiae bacterium]